MKLVKFVCAAKAHTAGRSESALTIHEGAWAFCAMGAAARGHDWQPSDGLPLADALRFSPRQQAPEAVSSAPSRPAPSAAAKSRARPR